MNANVLLIFLSIFAASCSSNENLDLGTIVFANVLYRHGDRTPVTNYPNDPYNETSWPVPYGQLTNIGKHQHLLLGRWLKNRYSHLLSDLYTPHDIYIQSTDVDRTLMSAEANLAGLYPPVQNQIWDSIKWMPIPVHTVPEKQDYVLRASKHCTRYNHELNKVLTSPELEHINKENAKLYAYLTKNSGGKISSLEEVEHLYDVLYIENLYNKTLPEWTKSVFPDKLKPLAILSFMTETYDKILQKLKSGPLLGEMINHMVKKAQKTLKPDRKVWVYSAHDETVANMLMTLNLFEPHCPPYAATILMELRTNSKNEYFVTVSYKNSTEEPILMTLEGCTTLCPLDKFVNLTKSAVIETLQEWELECLITWDDLTIHNKFWSVMEARNDISNRTLQWYWNKLRPEENATDKQIEDQESTISSGQRTITSLPGYKDISDNVNIWQEIDKGDLRYKILPDNELITHVLKSDETDKSETYEDISEDMPTTISHKEAENMMTKIIDWYENQEEAEPLQLISLRKIRNLASQKCR